MSAGINDIENRGVEGAPSRRGWGRNGMCPGINSFASSAQPIANYVPWNQQSRGFKPPPPSQIGQPHESGERPSRGYSRDLGGAYMAVFARCASRGRSSRLAHIARGAMYASRDDRPLDAHLRSEEHTSELQSRGHLVCRLLLEK